MHLPTPARPTHFKKSSQAGQPPPRDRARLFRKKGRENTMHTEAAHTATCTLHAKLMRLLDLEVIFTGPCR